MFIQTEPTPNPEALKFMPGMDVTGGDPMNYPNREVDINSPLAQLLFDIEGVKGVFFGSNFITITKYEDYSFELLKPQILLVIMEYLNSGKPIFESIKDLSANVINEDDQEIIKEIKELIETRVRPAVAMDGGDIILKGFEDGIVKLELHGSCSGCPSSTITLKNGIENMLKHYIPEIIAVEAV